MTGASRLWLAVAAAAAVAVGIVAFVAYGHGGATGTQAQQLASWASSTSLGQDIGTLQDDGAHVADAVARHQGTTSVHTVCAAMANDAQTFNGELPSPDTEVTQLLARAYGLEYDAAEACYRGAADASLLARSAHDRSAAKALFGRVLSRVAAVTHRTVSTTTTTVAGTTTSFL